MEYTVKQLAGLAGISDRTLRYYDQTGLLVPHRKPSGYRMYTAAEVDRLQQILFYRALDMPLSQIAGLLDAPGFDALSALSSHLAELETRQKQLDRLIQNAKKTIRHLKGETKMNDEEKFEGFKSKMIEDNEQAYGAEIREKYGDETIDASNKKLKNMTAEQYAKLEALSAELNETLVQALATADPAGELAQKTVALHKDWLMFFWPAYSPEAHKGLGQMYVDDERFTAYYDKIAPGAAVFLRDAINLHAGA